MAADSPTSVFYWAPHVYFISSSLYHYASQLRKFSSDVFDQLVAERRRIAIRAQNDGVALKLLEQGGAQRQEA